MNQDRRHVAQELDELKARLLAMGGLAEDHLRRAMRGLVDRNPQLLLMSRHLERVGDHATSIAEDVIFIVEARDVRHRSTKPAVTTNQAGGTTIERRKEPRVPPV